MDHAFVSIQDNLFQKMRQIWTQHGHVHPMAFLLTGGDLRILALPGDKAEQQAELALHQQLHKPDAVVFHAEAWVVFGDAAAEAAAARQAGLSSLEAFPGRKEAVVSTLQVGEQTRCLIAEVRPNRTLGPTTELTEALIAPFDEDEVLPTVGEA